MFMYIYSFSYVQAVGRRHRLELVDHARVGEADGEVAREHLERRPHRVAERVTAPRAEDERAERRDRDEAAAGRGATACSARAGAS